MLLHQFINRHRSQYDKNKLVNDLSVDQRREALKMSLSRWSSDVDPRLNCSGSLLILAGYQEAIFPLDYLSTTYSRLVELKNGTSTETGITMGSSNFVYGYGYSALPYGSIPVTAFPPGYDVSYSEVEVLTTQTNRGREAINLGSPASSSKQVKIIYDGVHQIEDEGKLLTINSLPNEGDQLTVNEQEYLFGSEDDEIEIASNIYEQAEVINDFLYLNQTSNKVETIIDANNILLRPVILGTKVKVTTDSNTITISKLPALNTISSRHHWKIFQLMLHFIADCKERQAIAEESFEAADKYNRQKIEHLKLVKPYLHSGR